MKSLQKLKIAFLPKIEIFHKMIVGFLLLFYYTYLALCCTSFLPM